MDRSTPSRGRLVCGAQARSAAAITMIVVLGTVEF
jgi:hypothetical protein